MASNLPNSAPDVDVQSTFAALVREREAAGAYGDERITRGSWCFRLSHQPVVQTGARRVLGFATELQTGQIAELRAGLGKAEVIVDSAHIVTAQRSPGERRLPDWTQNIADLPIAVRNWHNGTLVPDIPRDVARHRADQVIAEFPAILRLLMSLGQRPGSMHLGSDMMFASDHGSLVIEALKRITRGASVDREMSRALDVPQWAWRRFSSLDEQHAMQIEGQGLSIVRTVSALARDLQPDQFPRDGREWLVGARLARVDLLRAALAHDDWRVVAAPFGVHDLREIDDYLGWHSEIAENLFDVPGRYREIHRIGLARLKRASDRWHIEIPRLNSDLGISSSETWSPWFRAAALEQLAPAGWRVRELCSAVALDREGLEMNHCVGTYSGLARAERCTILALHGPNGERATLEVIASHAAGHPFALMQCRGPGNQEAPAAGRVADSLLKAINAHPGDRSELYRLDIKPQVEVDPDGFVYWREVAHEVGIDKLCERLNGLLLVKVSANELRQRWPEFGEMQDEESGERMG